MFIDITEAYQVLSTNKKAAYDREFKQKKKENSTYKQKIALVLLLLVVLAYLLIDNQGKKPEQFAEEIQVINGTPVENGSAAEGVLKDEQQDVVNPELASPNKDTIIAKTDTTVPKSSAGQGKIAKAPTVTASNTVSTNSVTSVRKELSKKEMQEILSALREEKLTRGHEYNCVRVLRTSSSNVNNWETVPVFLRANGFIISGREVVRKEVTGLQIDLTGECFTLTIGKF